MNGIIGVAGLLFTIFAFILGRRLTKKQRSENRIGRVVDKYRDFREKLETSDLDGLLRSGVANLKNDAEIRKAVETIMNYGDTSPLQVYASALDDIDLKEFFTEAARQRIKFHEGNKVKRLIADLKKV